MLDYLNNSATLLAQLVIPGLVLVVLLFLLGLFTGAFTGSGRINVSHLQRGVLALVLVLYVVFPHDLIFVGLHSIALATALMLFLVFQPNRMDWQAFLPYLLFGLPLLIVTFLAILDGGQLDNALKLRALFLGILTSLLFSLYFRSAADVKPLVKLFLPVVVAAAVLGIVQSLTGENYYIKEVYGDYYGERGDKLIVGWGFGYNHLSQGMALMGGMAIALYAMVQYRGNRLLTLGLFMLFIIALVIAPSQGAWIGSAVLILTFSTLAPLRRSTSTRIIVPVVMVITAWGVLHFAILGSFDPSSAISSSIISVPEQVRTVPTTLEALTSGSGSWDVRLKIWQDGLGIFTSSPIWGVGISNFNVASSLATDSHNIFLSVLAETGLIGFAGFLLMHGVIFHRAWRRSTLMDRDTQLAVRVALSFMAGLWAVGLLWHLEVNRFYWIALGILNGLSCPMMQPIVASVTTEAEGNAVQARRSSGRRGDGGHAQPVFRPGGLASGRS